MSTKFSLTDTEWKVVGEIRRLLGPNLANYLLSGLGEAGAVHCRAFTTLSAPSHAEEVTYRFEMRDESGRKGLPAGHDPLGAGRIDRAAPGAPALKQAASAFGTATSWRGCNGLRRRNRGY
jgi:hypothetical protein